MDFYSGIKCKFLYTLVFRHFLLLTWYNDIGELFFDSFSDTTYTLITPWGDFHVMLIRKLDLNFKRDQSGYVWGSIWPLKDTALKQKGEFFN